MNGRIPIVAALVLASAAVSGAPAARAREPDTVTIFAAGTLAVPFRQINTLFEKKYPDAVVHAQFGGSVKMTKMITELHRRADVLAVADYSVIPKYVFGGNGRTGYGTWYVGFARNAITFVYTGKSKFARDVNAKDWYKVLARPGVEIGRSNPDTDPSGYQTLQMLTLAQTYYKDPGLEAAVLKNAPQRNIRDTETSLLAALQLGQIDYLAIYRSDALQHHLDYLRLPAKINLSDPVYAAGYAKAVAHTKNGALPGKPIVYALTIPNNAVHSAWAEKYVALVLGPEGQKVMAHNGFGTVHPAYAANRDKMPSALRPLVKPWPGT